MEYHILVKTVIWINQMASGIRWYFEWGAKMEVSDLV